MRFGILSRCFYLCKILFVLWCSLFKGIFCRFFLFILRSISSWRLLSGQFQHIATTSALAPGKAIFEIGILILSVGKRYGRAKFVFRTVLYPFCLYFGILRNIFDVFSLTAQYALECSCRGGFSFSFFCGGRAGSGGSQRACPKSIPRSRRCL